MAARKPLVLNAGKVQQLQSADDLEVTVLQAARGTFNPNAAGSTPLLLQNVASPTVNVLTILLGATVPFVFDKIGSLKTLEASRICPWIEPLVEASATTINSTTAADITGLAFPAFTPGSDCRAEIKVFLDAKYATTGSGFLGELNVNTVADASQIIWNPQTVNERAPLAWGWQLVLSAGTTYTIKMQGKLSGGAGSFSIAAKSRMTAVIVGRM